MVTENLRQRLVAFELATDIVERLFKITLKREEKHFYIDTDGLSKLVLTKRTKDIARASTIEDYETVVGIQQIEQNEIIPYFQTLFEFEELFSSETIRRLKIILRERLKVSNKNTDPLYKYWKSLRDVVNSTSTEE